MLSWFQKKPKFRFDSGSLDTFRGRNILSEIQSGTLDGVVISQLFDAPELNNIRNGIASIFPGRFSRIGDVLNFPQGFAGFTATGKGPEESSRYFKENDSLATEFSNLFGLDYQGRIEEAFRQLSGGLEPKVPVGPGGCGHYACSSIRVINEGGRLNAHCGNFFYEPYYAFYRHLETMAIVRDQLSFFVLLTPPKEGGELVLFNLRWKDGQRKKEDKPELLIISDPAGKDFVWTPQSTGKSSAVPMQAGDMIVFAGGEIWHKVSQPRGSVNRVTIGGFLGRSTGDEGTLYYWS